jgi:hypothetical protein
MQDTAINNVQPVAKQNKLIIYFLLLWTALNILQAATLEVHADEAYYWLYSRFMDWGYYDHPPMVAVFIRAGYGLIHNSFGLRLLTVICSSLSLWFIWLTLKKYRVDALTFILVVSGIFVFHIYGFITTPDAPLLIFTVLFLFFLQQYLEQDGWKLALILGIIAACLLYSKYHGILLLGCTVISSPKLFKRASFYGIVVLALVLFIPHILWQVNNEFPSISYHLAERSDKPYDLSFSYNYPLGQLLMAGPLIGWLLFYKGFTLRIKDAFARVLLVNSIGILLFFFLTSFKGEVQLHWTLIAYVPLCMLALIHFTQPGGKPAWFNRLAMINIGLIVFVRLLIIAGPPILKQMHALRIFYDFKDWAKLVHDKAGDNYVIFNEGFQNPSKYNFYNNTLKGFDYDPRYYRRTQYEFWPIEDSLQHKRAYYVLEHPQPGFSTDTINTPAGTWYGGWVDDVRTYQKIEFEATEKEEVVAPGQQKVFDLTFKNPYRVPVSFSNKGQLHQVIFEASFIVDTDVFSSQRADNSFYNISLKPGETTHFKFNVTAPAKPGKYQLVFSLLTDPFNGGRNSKAISYTVK